MFPDKYSEDSNNIDTVLDNILSNVKQEYDSSSNSNNNISELNDKQKNKIHKKIKRKHKLKFDDTNIDDTNFDDTNTNDDIKKLKTKRNNILSKFDISELNKGWNDKNERIIISIGENAASYKWMHEKNANIHKTIFTITSIILIVLSTILSTESILPDHSDIYAQSIIRKVIIYIITVVSILQNFLKSQEKGEKHLTYANLFGELYHDIQQQMCNYRRNRINATKYLSNCLKHYDNIVLNGPDISQYIINKFKKIFRNAEISLPGIADQIQKIEIITEPIIGNDTNEIRKKSILPFKKNTNNLDKTLEKNNNCTGHLEQIHNAFKIHGDITEMDLKEVNNIELVELRKKFLKEKSNFEYQRYLQHNLEDD